MRHFREFYLEAVTKFLLIFLCCHQKTSWVLLFFRRELLTALVHPESCLSFWTALSDQSYTPWRVQFASRLPALRKPFLRAHDDFPRVKRFRRFSCEIHFRDLYLVFTSLRLFSTRSFDIQSFVSKTF